MGDTWANREVEQNVQALLDRRAQAHVHRHIDAGVGRDRNIYGDSAVLDM